MFYRGEECGAVREYSDTLAMFMLNGRRPSVFKHRAALEHTGRDGGPIAIDDIRSRLAARVAAALAGEAAGDHSGAQ